jgi:DNA-directed RNA polymerase specialized sigma24 family protein
VDVLDSYPAYLEFLRITRAFASRKGLDPDEMVQESALRIIRNDKVINDENHWGGYCATVAFSCCTDAWRDRYRRPEPNASLDEANELGIFSWEQKASLCALQTQLEAEEFERLVQKRGAVLQSLVKSATYLPAAARRVLEILLAAADQEDSYKKNGKLNGNAIAQKANISQSTISRQLSVIQDAAVEMLGEMEAAEEMDMW